MKEESLLLLSDLQKLINQVVLIDYTIIILGGDNHQSGNKGTGRTVKRGKKGRKTSAKRKENFGVGTKES